MARPHREWILAAILLLQATCCSVTAANADWKESQDAGRKALAAGDLDPAEDRMKEAIVAAKKLGPEHQPELVESFVSLSDVYLKQARMTEANILLEQSLLLLAQTPGADSRVLDQIYNNLATVRIFQQNLVEAESLLRRALAIREKRLGREHVDLAELLDRLAELAMQQKDDEDALSLHERGLAIREKAPGAGPGEVIKALEQGADWYQRRGHGDKAEPIWRRLLPIQEKTLGHMHRDVADTLMKIVAHHIFLSESGFMAMNRKVTAKEEKVAGFRNFEPMLTRSLAIREQALGPDNSDTIVVVQYLAAGYALSEDWARTVPLYERILRAREKAPGSEPSDFRGPLQVLASVAMFEHRYRDAIPVLKRLVAIEAAERLNAPKDELSLSRSSPYLSPDADENFGVEPRDFAFQLRKAIRLADLELTPDAFPTDGDLAFLKSEQWCPTVSNLAGLEELTSLVLEDKRVDNAALAHLRGLVSLRLLVVNRGQPINTEPKIDDAGLAQLRNLTGLKKLDIGATAIRGPGLSALAKMNELRWLNLNFTPIDDAGLTALPILPSLEHLQLSGTQVSDASLPVLKRLAGLKELWILNTKISAKGAAEFERAMPGVKIFGPKFNDSRFYKE